MMRLPRAGLLLIVVVATAAEAQEFRPVVDLGVTAALVPSMSRGFSDGSCGTPKAFAGALGGRLSVRPVRRVAIEGTLDGLAEPPSGACDIFFPRPPIENGTRTDSAFADTMRGYPLAHSSLRAVMYPVTAAAAEIRVHGGIGWFIGRDITTTQVGVAGLLGHGTTRVLVEGDLMFYSTREVENSATFQNFQVVSFRSAPFRRLDLAPVFRIGVQTSLGRR